MEGSFRAVAKGRQGILNFAPMPRNVVLFIAASEDGYIADLQGNIDFLNMAEIPGEDYGYVSFTASVDTVIMGRKTFDKVQSLGVAFPHEGKEVLIFSRKEQNPQGHCRFVQESPQALVTRLKTLPGKDIYCDGGAEIIAQLLDAGLIDRIILTIIPVQLLEGIPLFPGHTLPEDFSLLSEQGFARGIVQRVYEREPYRSER